ncbi:hypothetical protein ACKWTF_015245 [Chironomus riparius]
MNEFLIFCILLLLIYETKGQTAKCDYKIQNHFTFFDKSNANHYTCLLDTTKAQFNVKLTETNGQHTTGYSDADVIAISNNKNKLKTFSSTFCQKFPNLEIIKISHGEMESIDEDSLLNCQNLKQFWLDYNKVRTLPEKLFIKNSKLIFLRVYADKLAELPENVFQNLIELEDLFLDNNQISYLPNKIFHSLVKLQVLYLNNNLFQTINPEWFVNLLNLKWLSLEGNLILEVPSKCFESLRNLERLWIIQNKIKDLNSDSFDGLENLKILSLYINEISDLPVGVFTKLRNLQRLSLYGNNLTTIHSDSFGIHNQLTAIHLQENLINSVDPKFIDNTAVDYLDMTNNICSQTESKSRSEVENNLRNCFTNYRARPVRIPSTCGRSVMPQGNIIGGTNIKPNSYPWIAALMTPKGQLFCGGTLVSNRKVVSAAHCIQNKGEPQKLLPRSIIVLLGFYDLSIPIEVGRAPYAVQGIHIHPDWNPYTSSYDADIAVLMLNRDVTFNEFIQPICMTSTDQRIAEKTEGAVVGNGKGGQANQFENIPKILKIPIKTDRHCTKKDSIFKDLLTGRTFCAGSGTGQGVCTGDSGSGFVVQIENVFYLRGVVSASLGDSILGCDVNSYSVFTDALKYVNWINGLKDVPVYDDRIIFPY